MCVCVCVLQCVFIKWMSEVENTIEEECRTKSLLVSPASRYRIVVSVCLHVKRIKAPQKYLYFCTVLLIPKRYPNTCMLPIRNPCPCTPPSPEMELKSSLSTSSVSKVYVCGCTCVYEVADGCDVYWRLATSSLPIRRIS